MRARALLPSLVLLALAPACSWHECDSSTIDFELPKPGDEVELRVIACTDRGATDVDLDLRVGEHRALVDGGLARRWGTALSLGVLRVGGAPRSRC